MISQNDNKNTAKTQRKILFVCTGNTCRSPMAEYYFNSEMKKRGKESEITAYSRGLYAERGSYMSGNAKKVLVSNNIAENMDDIQHQSGQVDDEAVKEAELIYGITANHELRLKEEFPKFKDKILCMPEDINDPYGGSLEIYEQCFKYIKNSVDIIIKSLTEDT